jgi:hypothetical protein
MDDQESRRVVDGWIKELATSLKIQLSLDDEGVCSLQVGEESIITIELSRDHPQVHLYSTLISFPEEDLETSFFLMSRALELNAFQALTRGGSIGVLPGGGVLIFSYNVPIHGTDSVAFGQQLSTFYEAALEIKHLLSEASVPSDQNKPTGLKA